MRQLLRESPAQLYTGQIVTQIPQALADFDPSAWRANARRTLWYSTYKEMAFKTMISKVSGANLSNDPSHPRIVMRFFSTVAIALPAILAGCARGALVRRQSISDPAGVIAAPAAASTITPGAPFSVNYENSNNCESGYSPVAFYLLSEDPTTASVTRQASKLDCLACIGRAHT